ncbi:MAG: hypothetical protein HYU48_00495 [Candidatus Levybacteria bacterium]|nr:hypothetical protein [Candidatus Levybacteria bacterium]
MTEQGESLIPDAIINSKATPSGEIEKTIHPVDSNGEVKPPLKQRLARGYDNGAKPTEKPVPDTNLKITGQNKTTRKA